ncbi:cysteine-rich VLP domain-containing protein [Oxobacter pfennigii]|uniref:cysteine-rich VLP domain-containing protein n=1 Tax=Oxobacter pfennigii TaxID=36849 RepID=UPI0006D4889F|nr:cysteine-rich VLP domain-containing protein [Oxobacter pfennigii]
MAKDPAEARELTRSEREAIRRLVVGMCANYDPEYGCLPLNCPCYMLNKWWTGAYCKYFQNAVLPLDSVLEAKLTGINALLSRRICPVCGAVFIPVTSQAYCSEACQQEGNRRRSRERMRKKRQNKGV